MIGCLTTQMAAIPNNHTHTTMMINNRRVQRPRGINYASAFSFPACCSAPISQTHLLQRDSGNPVGYR